MNCFYHQDRPAVGICKNCQRGLCPQCAAEVADGLACTGRCEDQVLLLGNLIRGNAQGNRRLSTVYIAMGIATAVLAIAMNLITLQLSGIQEEAPAFNYTTIPFYLMAAVLIVIGIAQRRNGRG